MNSQSNNNTSDHLKHTEFRLKQFKELGYDIVGSRKYVLKCAGELTPKILELGTGKGHTAMAIAKAGYSLTSIDNDPDILDIAKAWIAKSGLLSSVDLICENIEKLNFPNNSYSTIISVDLWHHLKNYRVSLNEMLRVWNGKGPLVISDLNENGMKIVNDLHESEGNIHSCCKIGINKLGDILNEMNIPFIKNNGVCEMVYVINKKTVLSSSLHLS